jgi:hypothetical protein
VQELTGTLDRERDRTKLRSVPHAPTLRSSSRRDFDLQRETAATEANAEIIRLTSALATANAETFKSAADRN